MCVWGVCAKVLTRICVCVCVWTISYTSNKTHGYSPTLTTSLMSPDQLADFVAQAMLKKKARSQAYFCACSRPLIAPSGAPLGTMTTNITPLDSLQRTVRTSPTCRLSNTHRKWGLSRGGGCCGNGAIDAITPARSRVTSVQSTLRFHS